jgi:hypothetical protein
MGLITARLPPHCLKSKAPRVRPSTKWASRWRLRRRPNRVGPSQQPETIGEIEVELEIISSKATRIRTGAKQGFFFKDRPTATEIILQTEKILYMDVATANGRGTRDAAKAVGEGVKR